VRTSPASSELSTKLSHRQLTMIQASDGSAISCLASVVSVRSWPASCSWHDFPLDIETHITRDRHDVVELIISRADLRVRHEVALDGIDHPFRDAHPQRQMAVWMSFSVTRRATSPLGHGRLPTPKRSAQVDEGTRVSRTLTPSNPRRQKQRVGAHLSLCGTIAA
jgi:hypothetical protein